jgi:hypothetical protein
MTELDEAAEAAQRLDLALDRIAAQQEAVAAAAAQPRIDPRITTKLDNLIRALRTALEQ